MRNKVGSKVLSLLTAFALCLGSAAAVTNQTTTTQPTEAALFSQSEKETVVATQNSLSGQYSSPSDVVVDELGGKVYVADYTSQVIRVVDVASAQEENIISLEDGPNALLLSESQRTLYVAAGGAAGKIYTINLVSHAVEQAWTTGHTPSAMQISADGNLLYVANRFSGTVQTINTATGDTVEEVSVTREPMSLVRAGNKLFVASHLITGSALDDRVAADVVVLDLTKPSLSAPDAQTTIRLYNGVTNVKDMAVSPDGAYLYVTHVLGRYNVATTQGDRGWIYNNAMTEIRISDLAITATMLLDDLDLGAGNPWGIAVDDQYIFVAISGMQELMRIDRIAMRTKIDAVTSGSYWTGKNQGLRFDDYLSCAEDISTDFTFLTTLKTRISLGQDGPRAIASSGEMIYVGNYFGGSISMVNPHSGNVNTVPFGTAIESDVRAGERLWNDATIGFQSWQSCASCHPDARVDGLNWDNLNDGIGTGKQARTMLDTFNKGKTMATGIRPSAYAAVRAGIKYIMFNGGFPESESLKIDAYLKSLVAEESPRLENGMLSESALRGKSLFEGEAGCATCHAGPLKGNSAGQEKMISNLSQQGNESRALQVASLIEVWRTGPYLYDGRAATVREVLTVHNPGYAQGNGTHGNANALSETEIDDVEQYVLSLSSDMSGALDAALKSVNEGSYPAISAWQNTPQSEIEKRVFASVGSVIFYQEIEMQLETVSYQPVVDCSEDQPIGTRGSYVFRVILRHNGEERTSNTMTVGVDPVQLLSVALLRAPQKTSYRLGESLDLSGGEIKLHYGDGTTKRLPISNEMVPNWSADAEGTHTITVSHTGKETSFAVNVLYSYMANVKGYVVADGLRYYDTGYVPNERTVVVAEYTQPMGAGKGFLFGVDQTWSAGGRGFSYYVYGGGENKYTSLWNGTGAGGINITPVGANIARNPVTVTMGQGELYLNTVAQKRGGNPSVAFTAPATLRIFALFRASRNINQEFPTGTKLYTLEIYEDAQLDANGVVSDGTLVRDFIPAQLSDGQDVLYDTCTKQIHTLQGELLATTVPPRFIKTISSAEYLLKQSAQLLDATAVVTDGGTVRYQWHRNGEAIEGAVQATYTPDTTQVGESTYSVVASNYHEASQQVTATATASVTITVERGEFVVSDGLHYYDTGYVPNQDTVVVAKYVYPSSASEGFLFGVDTNWTAGQNMFAFYTGYRGNNNQSVVAWGAKEQIHTPTGTSIADNKVALTFGKGQVYLNGNKQNLSSIPAVATFTSPSSLRIFATYRAVSGIARESPRGVKLYELQIYQNPTIEADGTVTGGTLVRSYGPESNSEGETILYDTITQKEVPKMALGAQLATFTAAAQGTWKDATYAKNAVADSLNGAAEVARGTLNYQWYRNDKPVAGANAAAYQPSTAVAGSYRYYIEVTNTDPSGLVPTSIAKSKVIYITVEDPTIPRVVTGEDITGFYGTTAGNVGVEATVSVGTLSYQWYQGTSKTDRTPSAAKLQLGETEPTMELSDTLPVGVHYYFCAVTSKVEGQAQAIVISNVITVTVEKATSTDPFILTIKTDHSTYKPGDTVHAELWVSDGGGRNVGSLGTELFFPSEQLELLGIEGVDANVTGNIATGRVALVAKTNGGVEVPGEGAKLASMTFRVNPLQQESVQAVLTLKAGTSYLTCVGQDGLLIMPGQNETAITITQTGRPLVELVDYVVVPDGKQLVKVTGALETGKVYRIEETTLFYSGKASAYLGFIANHHTVDTASKALTVHDGEVESISYTGDIDKNKRVLPNDARIIYTIYNGMSLAHLSSDMDYLSIDVNGDLFVNLTDVLTILQQFLGL